MSNNKYMWIIQSSKSRNIVGCFFKQEDAEQFIYKHQLQCILTQFPMDQSVYDWVIENGFWKPKFESQTQGEFISDFSSAYLKHEHFNQEVD